MSSILRSSKFVRCFVGFARNFLVNSTRHDAQSFVFCNNFSSASEFSRPLAVHVVSNQIQPGPNNLEKSLSQLDQDVRRTGRLSRRDIEEVLEEIRQSKSATSSQSLLVIRCCGNLVPEELPEVRTQLVQQIWKTLDRLKVPMDISHYNALLRVYLENEYAFEPTQFLADLEKKGVEPNRVTYQRLITRYCQVGDIEGATRILEYMREKNLPVNESVFNALIMGHSQTDDMESASSIINVMAQTGLEPSADTYTTLLCGYAKKGDIDKIRSIYEECEKKDIHLLDKDHMDVIYSLAANGHAQYVDEVLPKIRKSTGYNQDAVNLILRLVNKEQEDVALKILLTMIRSTRADGSQPMAGNFFIKQLIKAQRPVEKILEICQFLENEGLNPKATSIAAETSLIAGNAEQTCLLLKTLSQNGFPIRQHYFWPLLCSAGKTKKNDNILQVLRLMISEFNLQPNIDTIRDYVIPYLKTKSYDELISLLKSVGIPPASAAVGLIQELLMTYKIKDAAEIASKYKAFFLPTIFRRILATALDKTRDVNSYLTLVHNIHDGLDRSVVFKDDTDSTWDKRDVVGNLIIDVIKAVKTDKEVILQAVLQGLLDKGLGITNATAEKIQSQLNGEELTNEISNLLESLTSNALEPEQAERKSIKFSSSLTNVFDEGTLINKIKKLEDAGQPTLGLKCNLFALYCKQQQLDKAEELFKELELNLAPGLYSAIIEAFTKAENVEKALEYKQKLATAHKDASISSLRAVRLAALLVKNDRFDEAFNLLESCKNQEIDDNFKFNIRAICFQMLNGLAEEGKVEQVKKLFDILTQNQIVEVTNVLLGPLIKVHIKRDDLQSALDEFERLSLKYKMTPWKHELSCKLIEKEDANALQKLTDLSTAVHGEGNSLYDLVFSFVECGRIRQARKILETPGLRSRPQRLNTVCEKYAQEGSVASLEGLIEATRDISYIDRADIFNHLLKTYISKNEPEKALGLWTQMQDEDVQPSEEFLVQLGSFLKESGHDVPFVMPNVAAPVSSSKPAPKPTEPKKSEPNADIRALRQASKAKNANKVISLSKELESKNNKLSQADKSLVIEAWVLENNLSEAYKLALQMFTNKEKITIRHLNFLINKLASQGFLTEINELSSYLNQDEKRLVSFNNKLCFAHVVAGKANEFLDHLEEEIATCKEEEVQDVNTKFPRGGALGLLEKHPELLPKFEQIGLKYYEKGLTGPLNVVWQAHFNIPEKSEKIFTQYLSNTPRLMFQKIIKDCKDNNDEESAKRLIKLLSKSKVNDGGIGVAYSCLLDILVQSNKLDEALDTLKEGIEKVSLENFNTSALQRIKTATEAKGKTFPYTIPPKKKKRKHV